MDDNAIMISIHAPARGATKSGCAFAVKRPVFQSTLPRGERPSFPFSSSMQYPISIHAPARGATNTGREYGTYSRFQSTLPRGERPRRLRCVPFGRRFQSTLPRGERRNIGETGPPYVKFQSTLPRGERLHIDGIIGQCFQFQSTLPRGERLSARPPNMISRSYFNPRSREGSDEFDEQRQTAIIISIHAPARGATFLLMGSFRGIQFQSTLPRGERRQKQTNSQQKLISFLSIFAI